jgi:hypothetical protein
LPQPPYTDRLIDLQIEFAVGEFSLYLCAELKGVIVSFSVQVIDARRRVACRLAPGPFFNKTIAR